MSTTNLITQGLRNLAIQRLLALCNEEHQQALDVLFAQMQMIAEAQLTQEAKQINQVGATRQFCEEASARLDTYAKLAMVFEELQGLSTLIAAERAEREMN